jgi:hypothetical protein
LESEAGKVTFVGGLKQGWKRAPSNVEALHSAIAISATKSAQAGTNTFSKDQLDGWGALCCLNGDSEVVLARFVDASSPQLSVGEWLGRSVETLDVFPPIEYGFAYSGSRPGDIYLGYGMMSGKMAREHAGYFGGEEGPAKWFRAKSWGTHREYLFSVFPANVLSDARAENVRDSFAEGVPGTLVRKPNGTLWVVEHEERRQEALSALSARGLCVVAHSESQASQARPAVASHS